MRVAKGIGTAAKVLDEAKGPALGTRALFGLLDAPGARKAWGNLAGLSMKEAANKGSFQTLRAAVKGGKISALDAAQGLGIPTYGKLAAAKYSLVQKALTETDDAKAYDLLMNGEKSATGTQTLGLGHKVTVPKSLYNAHAAMASATRAASTGKLDRVRAMGAITEHIGSSPTTEPVAFAYGMRNLSLLAGMKPAEYGDLADTLMKAATGMTDEGDVEGVTAAAMDWGDAILKAYQESTGVTKKMLDDVQGYRMKSAMRQPLAQGAGTVSYSANPLARTPEEAADVIQGSARKAGSTAAQRMVAQGQVDKLQWQLDQLQQAKVSDDDPTMIATKNALSSLQRPVPVLTRQLADSYQFPYSPYEMLVAKHASLRNLEKTQALVRADALSSVWKRWAIGRVSSSFRITLGDDTIRPVIALAGAGHFGASAKLLGSSIAKSVGLLAPGSRQRVLEQAERIFKDPEVRRIMQDYGDYLQDYAPHAFQAYFPTTTGYAAALHHVVTNLFAPDPMVQEWLSGYEKGGLTGARQSLEDLVQSSLKPAGKKASLLPDPKVASVIRAQNGDLDAQHLQLALNRWHSYMADFMRDDDVRAGPRSRPT